MSRTAMVCLALLLPSVAANAQMAQPGPEHEALAQLVGEWTGELRFEMPGMEPMTSQTQLSNRMDFGGLWLVGEHEGQMMGAPFRGLSVWGYDSSSGKYVESWVDSFRSSMSQLEGEYDASKRRFTKTMEGKNPMTGEPMTERHTVSIIDADHFRMELAADDGAGGFMPYLVVEYSRAGE